MWTFWGAYHSAVKTYFASKVDLIQRSEHLSEEQRAKHIHEANLNLASFDDILNKAHWEEKVAAVRRCDTLSWRVHVCVCVPQGKRRLSWPAAKAALFIYLYRDQPALQMPWRVLQVCSLLRQTSLTICFARFAVRSV